MLVRRSATSTHASGQSEDCGHPCWWCDRKLRHDFETGEDNVEEGSWSLISPIAGQQEASVSPDITVFLLGHGISSHACYKLILHGQTRNLLSYSYLEIACAGTSKQKLGSLGVPMSIQDAFVQLASS